MPDHKWHIAAPKVGQHGRGGFDWGESQSGYAGPMAISDYDEAERV